MRNVHTLGIVLVLGAWLHAPAVASAQGASSLTALPWPGAYVRVAEGDRRGQVTLTGVPDGTELRLRLDLSAPFDDASRTAAFTDARGSTRGFAASAFLGYESWYRDHTVEASIVGRLCHESLRPSDVETDDEIQDWCNARQDEYRRLRASPEVSIAGGHGTTVEGSAGGEVSFSFDRLRVRPMSDVGATAVDEDQISFRGGFRGALYFDGRYALTLRGGIGFEREVDTRDVESCSAVSSTSMPTLDARACSTLQQLTATPAGAFVGYGSLAFTALIRELTMDNAVPGFELQASFEDLGVPASVFVPRAVIFLSPLIGGSIARFGIGLDARVRLTDSADGSRHAGDIVWAPFLVVGATLGAGAPPIL